jgi:hypothetical protein
LPDASGSVQQQYLSHNGAIRPALVEVFEKLPDEVIRTLYLSLPEALFPFFSRPSSALRIRSL